MLSAAADGYQMSWFIFKLMVTGCDVQIFFNDQLLMFY